MQLHKRESQDSKNLEEFSKAGVKPIQEALDSAREQTSKTLHDVETKAALLASRAQVRFLKASASTRERVHRRPLTAVLAGFGTGCLIGAIVGFVARRPSKAEFSPASPTKGEGKI